jgi:hypothetical protein
MESALSRREEFEITDPVVIPSGCEESFPTVRCKKAH